MAEKSEAPAGRPGPKGTSLREGTPLPHDAILVHGSTFWLRVDGREERRFLRPPLMLRCLAVEVIQLRSGRLVEEARINNSEGCIVPPRGKRWRLHSERETYSVWRRPVAKGGGS